MKLRIVLLAFVLSSSTSRLPERISDADFRQMIADLSEPEGLSFGGPDNFVSNEIPYQVVIPALRKRVGTGGVYLGVGPEQNFSYIAALQPKISFIIDIRRQNLLEHLVYKALFEMSADRAEFLSRLFSRQRPNDVGKEATPATLVQAYERAVPDSKLYAENLAVIKDRLSRHGFQLSADDLSKIEHIYQAFFTYGPRLNYVGLAELPADVSFPNFGQLMLQTDDEGRNWSFLANEENFRRCKDLEERNLIVPLTGDFAGSHTLRTLGRYLRDHAGAVSAVYASNVEEYLFEQNDNWRKYYSNLSTIPLNSRGVMIRSVSVTDKGVGHSGPGFRTIMVTQSIPDLLRSFTGAKVTTYDDVFHLSQCGSDNFAKFGCRR